MPRAKRPRLAPNYDRKLTRRITLADGTKLATLRDAANLFATQFATVKSCPLLEVAIGRLIVAAEDSKRDKAQAATEAIQSVLRDRRLDPVLVDEPAEHLGRTIGAVAQEDNCGCVRTSFWQTVTSARRKRHLTRHREGRGRILSVHREQTE